MSRKFDVEILWLIKKGRYFKYIRKRHIILNCLEKTKISTITNISNIDDIKNIDLEKG